MAWASRGVRPPGSGVPGPRHEGRVEPVDIEQDVGRAVADDFARLRDNGSDPHPVDILDVQHGHPEIVEKPQKISAGPRMPI